MISISPGDNKEEESQLPEARYSVSSLASSFYYNCEKHIYLLSRSSLNETCLEDSLNDAHCNRENVFEEELFKKHKDIMIDHSNSTDFKKVLQEAQPNTYLLQLKFKLPESFYKDVIKNTTSYRINNFIPDFLYIHQDPTTKVRKILIIDAKSSKEMKTSHQFQVASYAFFLQYLIQDIQDLEIDSLGGVWLSNDLEKPVKFRIDLMVEKIKYIYLDTLVIISNDSNPEWVLGKKCKNCMFINRCKQDASGTIRSIPYMSKAKATRLKESSMVDIEDLSEMLENLKIEGQISTKSTGYEGYVDAYNDKKVKFMGYASIKVAKEIDYGIYIYFQTDKISQKPFVYRIEVIHVKYNQKVSEKEYLTDYEQHSNNETAAYSDFIDRFVNDLASTLEFMHESNSRFLIYVYEAQEKKVIREILTYLVFSEGKDLDINGNNTDISGLDLDNIFNSWNANKPNQVKQYVKQRFYWLQEIMKRYWQLAFNFMFVNGIKLFPLICNPFKWPAFTHIRHQILAKLVFFKELECIKACDEVRMNRIRDLSIINHAGSSDETSIGGLVLDLQKQERVNQIVTNITFVASANNGPNLQQKLDRIIEDDFRRYILVPDTREDIIKAINFNDLSVAGKIKFFSDIHCVNVVKNGRVLIAVSNKSISNDYTRYRLYCRYIDFTTIQCINGLRDINEEDNVDVVKLIEDPNSWANTATDGVNLESDDNAIILLKKYLFSPSQKDISISILQKRLQIIWGPPGSGKTEFLALFVNWYIQYFVMNNPESKDLLIGVTAFTRDAIHHLLRRIEKVKKRQKLHNLYKIIYLYGYANGQHLEKDSGIIGCSSYYFNFEDRDKTKRNIYVVGTTVWNWKKAKNALRAFQFCDMMILDESTQLLVADALLAISCLKNPNGKLIVAGDHFQLSPIVENNYSNTRSHLDEPQFFGSILECLMRTEENRSVSTREFLLPKDTIRDFGPNTLQLRENWRMNEELNEFFKLVYGPGYTSRNPNRKLDLPWSQMFIPMIKRDLIKQILNPDQSISLVKLKCTRTDQVHDMARLEAEIVALLVNVYCSAIPSFQIRINQDRDKPSVIIVTPLNKQRMAIERRVRCNIPVGTVEKMQGRECDLVIACFSCRNKREDINEFLRDFKRINVALSRARCKVIVLIVDAIINPNCTEYHLKSFDDTDGRVLLSHLKNWTKERNSSFEWLLD